MRRLVFALALPLCFAAPAAFAALEWASSTIAIEAGPLDEKADVRFSFTNSGPEKITVTEVSSSCNCTVPTLEKRVYAPHEKGEIRAIFNFRGSVGHQAKTITVTTDEKGAHEYTLTLQVNIPQLFDVSPYFVSWKKDDAPEPRPVTIRALHPEIIRPVSVESQDNRFTAKLEKVGDAPETYRVLIEPKSTDVVMTVSIIVKTNFPEADPRVITLYGLVREK